jgi:hypothetical protein
MEVGQYMTLGVDKFNFITNGEIFIMFPIPKKETFSWIKPRKKNPDILIQYQLIANVHA